MKFYKVLTASIGILTIILAICIFTIPLTKTIPPGGDAGAYINDVRWIIQQKQLPEPNQIITHGRPAYPSPGSDIILSAITLVSGKDVVYPVFSWYQIILVILIFVTSYILGSALSQKTGLFFMLTLLGGFALTRLFVASTVSNLLAFSYVNIILYLTCRTIQASKKTAFIVLLVFLFVGLFLVHGYLTAPIFIPVYVVYSICLYIFHPRARNQVNLYVKNSGVITRIILACAGILIVSTMLFKFGAIFREASNAFTSGSTDKYQGVITLHQYVTYIGKPIWIPALLGLTIFIFGIRKKNLSFRLLPVLWVIALWLLMQSYHLGINFYYERLLILGGIILSFFAAFLFECLWSRATQVPVVTRTMIIVFVVLSCVPYGVNRLYDYYRSSNLVTNTQISALQQLNRIKTSGDVVISNVSAVSQTGHDVMISDATFAYLSTNTTLCQNNDAACIAFNTPSDDDSKRVFRSKNLKYVLLFTPSVEGNVNVLQLVNKFTASNAKVLYKSSDAWLFDMPSS